MFCCVGVVGDVFDCVMGVFVLKRCIVVLSDVVVKFGLMVMFVKMVNEYFKV